MKHLIMFIIFCFVFCFYWKETEADGIHEGIEDLDTYRNLSEIISSKGYPIEEHIVQTDDGYLLSVIRIPHGRRSNLNGDEKKVVLLIHGIANDATVFVLNFPDQSLGFILPDEGYDVWMINTRGCDYSKKHVEYRIDQRQFWNFSFNEVGQYDIPATIDYILKYTGKEALYIIGYSQGTTASFAMLSDKLDYNDKVKLLIAMAPVAFIGYSTSAYRPLIPFVPEIAFINDLFNHGEFLPDNQISKIFRAKFCSMTDFELCEIFAFAVAGVDRTQLNETRIDVYASRLPSSTSSKSFVHYAQLVQTKTFRKFDYGRRRNLLYYQQEDPPDYETFRIKTPIALIWSTNDLVADPTDVDLLRQTLPQSTLVFDYQVPYPYSHFDFALAENAPKLIYEPILQLLAEY